MNNAVAAWTSAAWLQGVFGEALVERAVGRCFSASAETPVKASEATEDEGAANTDRPLSRLSSIEGGGSEVEKSTEDDTETETRLHSDSQKAEPAEH